MTLLPNQKSPNINFEDMPRLPLDENVTKPNHYHKGGIDVIQFAKMQFPKEEVKGFMRINILKYATRYDRKGGVEDLKKLAKYTDLLIELEDESHAEKG